MSQYLTDCWSGIKSFCQRYWLGIAATVGTLAVLTYHKIVIDLLVNAANKSFGVANKKADALGKIEDADKMKAALAIQTAKDAQAQEKTEVITPDWNQK